MSGIVATIIGTSKVRGLPCRQNELATINAVFSFSFSFFLLLHFTLLLEGGAMVLRLYVYILQENLLGL